jgi:hypothetical protein
VPLSQDDRENEPEIENNMRNKEIKQKKKKKKKGIWGGDHLLFPLFYSFYFLIIKIQQ